MILLKLIFLCTLLTMSNNNVPFWKYKIAFSDLKILAFIFTQTQKRNILGNLFLTQVLLKFVHYSEFLSKILCKLYELSR